MFRFVFWLLPLALFAVAWLLWSQFRPRLRARQLQRARNEFIRNQPELHAAFLEAANATGKPRGLTWRKCDFQDSLYLAQDRGTGELLGLVGVTIGFEATPGGGMEEVEAVGNLRAATAVFSWNGRTWSTQGRAIFNLEPREALKRYQDTLEAISV